MSDWKPSGVTPNYEQSYYAKKTKCDSIVADNQKNFARFGTGSLTSDLDSYDNKKYCPVKPPDSSLEKYQRNNVAQKMRDPASQNLLLRSPRSSTYGSSKTTEENVSKLSLDKLNNKDGIDKFVDVTREQIEKSNRKCLDHNFEISKIKIPSGSQSPEDQFERNYSDVKINTTTIIPVSNKSIKVAKNDPNVKKLVYGTYRNFLSSYNNKANEMICASPRNKVQVDQGVLKQIDSITQGAVPPPPPPGSTVQAAKIKTGITDRRVEPPLCVQNAMLTKDKKPFTYTPGGLDLSEIRSPRMAKRLERNAMSEGVSPTMQQHQQNGQGNRTLPPSALAAMQPQMPVQVFPSGKVPHLNQIHQNGSTHAPPPPPPPPPLSDKSSALPSNPNRPLPTDAFDRPDMTKIIPENPMALLRKTQGPIVKQDPIFNKENYGQVSSKFNSLPSQNENSQCRPSEPSSYNENRSAGLGTIYVPPLSQKDPRSPPCSKSTTQILYAPPVADKNRRDDEQSPSFCKSQQSVPPIETSPRQIEIGRQISLNSPKANAQLPESPRELLSRTPAPWMTQKRVQQDLPEWVNKDSSSLPFVGNEGFSELLPHDGASSPGSLGNPQAYDWRRARPPIQENQQRSFENESSSRIFTPQVLHKGGERQPQIHDDNRFEYRPTERVEVVIVNDPPPVYYHPGQPQYNVRSPKISSQQDVTNVRIIPVKVEGANNGSPSSNDSSMAVFNRQQSWGSNPTQSNTFKILQKITQTDGDDDMPICEHSPKSTSKFPQRQVSAEQVKNSSNFSAPFNSGQNRGPHVRTIPIQLEGDASNGYKLPPSEQIVQEPKKYMGSSIPSRSFKILQAMTSPEECASVDDQSENKQIFSNVPTSNPGWEFNDPVTPYYYHPYWAPSYSYNYYSNQREGRPPSSKHLNPTRDAKMANESLTKHRLTPVPYCCYSNQNKRSKKKPFGYEQQFPPFWDPYVGGFYYGAAAPPGYPLPFYSQNDNEEFSGYSSTDEMSYYGARFATLPAFSRSKTKENDDLVNNKKDRSEASQTSAKSKSEEIETSDSDSEMTGYEVCHKPLGLQAIRSVSNINIYDEAQISEEEREEEYDNSDEENETLSIRSGEDAIPHQLSVIYEESEQIDNDFKFSREGSASSTVSEDTETVENSETEEGKLNGSVFVKLPLILNFGVNKNEQVATITVGDSQVVDDCDGAKRTNKKKEESTVRCVKDEEETVDVDWWGEINQNNVDSKKYKIWEVEVLKDVIDCSFKSEDQDRNWDTTKENEVDFWAEIIKTGDETSLNEEITLAGDSKNNSLSSRSSSCSRSQNSDGNECDVKVGFMKMKLTIDQQDSDGEIQVDAKNRTNAVDNSYLQKEFSRFNSRKSSVKSQEDCSEEDYDSGVTSDVSKNISEIDNESDFTEAKKVYQYQRAATHSRLFKLLQEECEVDDDRPETDSDNFSSANRKESLDLPLNKNSESFSSSGFNSPGSPSINNKFVSDLIQGLLQNEKMVCKNVTLEKIQAAAIKILEEDLEESSAEEGSSFLSSKNSCTESSTPAQTPQEFYCSFNDYSQYYDSWAVASNFSESNILPSKAFRLIQAHSANNKTGAITGLLARCPRVLSNKNVQKELMRLIELEKSPSPDPTKPVLDSNEAANAP